MGIITITNVPCPGCGCAGSGPACPTMPGNAIWWTFIGTATSGSPPSYAITIGPNSLGGTQQLVGGMLVCVRVTSLDPVTAVRITAPWATFTKSTEHSYAIANIMDYWTVLPYRSDPAQSESIYTAIFWGIVGQPTDAVHFPMGLIPNAQLTLEMSGASSQTAVIITGYQPPEPGSSDTNEYWYWSPTQAYATDTTTGSLTITEPTSPIPNVVGDAFPTGAACCMAISVFAALNISGGNGSSDDSGHGPVVSPCIANTLWQDYDPFPNTHQDYWGNGFFVEGGFSGFDNCSLYLTLYSYTSPSDGLRRGVAFGVSAGQGTGLVGLGDFRPELLYANLGSLIYADPWTLTSAVFCMKAMPCGCWACLIPDPTGTGDTAVEWTFTFSGFTATPLDADGCSGTEYNGTWTLAWDATYASAANCAWSEKQYLNGQAGGNDCTGAPVDRWQLAVANNLVVLATPYRDTAYSLLTPDFNPGASNTLYYGLTGAAGVTPPAGLPATVTISPGSATLCNNCFGWDGTGSPPTATATPAGIGDGACTCSPLNAAIGLTAISSCVLTGTTAMTCGGSTVTCTISLALGDQWTMTFSNVGVLATYRYYGAWGATMPFFYVSDDGTSCGPWPHTITVTHP